MRNDFGQFNYGQYILEKERTRVNSSTTADFDGDGTLDIATTWADGLYIHFNTDLNNIEEMKNYLPIKFQVSHNYPNPFNTSTKIQFEIFNTLILNSKIFDINGKEVKVYKSKKYLPGKYSLEWDGKNNLRKGVGSGLYFWHFYSDELSVTKKILLVK